MGRPRKNTPEALALGVRKYFRSITRRVPLTEQVPTGRMDDKGHPICETRPVINDLGKQVIRTEFILPPSVAGLCEVLGISRATWANYCADAAYQEITEEVRARMLAWNEQELLTRSGKDVKGIIFNLQQNYGYGGEKQEVEMSGGALEALLRKELE